LWTALERHLCRGRERDAERIGHCPRLVPDQARLGSIGRLGHCLELPCRLLELLLAAEGLGQQDSGSKHDQRKSPLLRFLDHATSERFIRPETRGIVVADADPASLVSRLRTTAVPQVPKWITDDER